jgi:hypothetical protein
MSASGRNGTGSGTGVTSSMGIGGWWATRLAAIRRQHDDGQARLSLVAGGFVRDDAVLEQLALVPRLREHRRRAHETVTSSGIAVPWNDVVPGRAIVRASRRKAPA